MKKLAIAFVSIAVLAVAAKAGDGLVEKKPSSELLRSITNIRELDSADFTALKRWFKGEGRKALHDRGITDANIGGMRFDTDLWGDAPWTDG